MKKIKIALYDCKRSLKNIFIYPKFHGSFVDYDSYWKDKRGNEIGSLSDWQIIRANLAIDSIRNNPKNDLSISDIGCGDGNILKYIREKISDKNFKLYGFDVSDFALNKAIEFGVECFTGDITNPKIVDDFKQVDYTIMFEILEHVQHSEILLKEAFDKSSSGVLFSFPNTGYLNHRLRLLFGRFPLQWRLYPGEHLRYWTYKDLVWWLTVQNYINYKITVYKGYPILNKIIPSLFGAGFFVELKK